jgi:hypothetical protein
VAALSGKVVQRFLATAAHYLNFNQGLIMKNSIALLCFALSAGVACAAPAAGNSDAFCAQISSDIAAQSALFSTVAGAEPGMTELTPSATAAVRQRAHNKDVALRNIANEIWSLRTRMTYLDCAQAKTFAY